jgi:adenylate kinase
MEKFNLIIFGPQGSGKGTQAKLLAKKFKMAIVAVGDLARKEAKAETSFGKKIRELLRTGKLLPKEIVEGLIVKKLQKIPKNKIIFDGFPRNFEQVQILKKIIQKFNLEEPIAIYLKIPRSVAISRIASRKICSECGQIFYPGTTDYEKGICSRCGQKIISREDDTKKAIENRLAIYYQETEPVISFYRQQKRLIEINGRPKIEKVYQNILEKLNDYFKNSSGN